MVKFIKDVKQTWNGLKDSQRAYVFEAVWFGNIVPGIPLSEKGKVKMLMNKVKNKIGNFPGLKYKEAFEIIEKFRFGVVSKNQLLDVLYQFYPVNSRIGLKLNSQDIDFNRSVRNKLEVLDRFVLDEIVLDLHQSEERDKKRVLATI